MGESPFQRAYRRHLRVDPAPDVEDELEFHIVTRTEALVREGVAPAEARARAEREFGDVARIRKELHEMARRRLRREGRVRSWEALGQDLRFAVRSLAKTPGFAAVVVLTLALGIGANTAMFSVIDAVLLEPLPYPGADRIVTLSTSFGRTGATQRLVSIANFRDWRDQSSSFEAMSTYRGGEYPVTAGAAAEYARTATVAAGFFRVFGVEPLLGRTFMPEETTPGSRAVVISHAYWQSRFAGDAGVLERTLLVGDDPWPIVGVMPPGFRFPRETDLWLPQMTTSTSRTGHNFFAVARLAPDVSLDQAQAELAAIAARLERVYPETNTDRGVVATRLQDDLAGDVRLTLYLLWGVVGVVLLIACANTATLLLGRASARAREMAVRASLGAGRLRIVHQLMTEGLVLALLAGTCGILLAHWGVKAFAAVAPAEAVRGADVGIDGGVLAFTLGISLVTSVLFGLVPSLHASRVDLTVAIKEGGERAARDGRIVDTRGVLLASEIALAVVLLTGAGLLTKTLVALHGVELGFRPANVLVMKATGPRSFFDEALERIRDLPGAVAVGATSTPPTELSNAGSGYHYADRLPEERDRSNAPSTWLTIVTPGTFSALGTPVISGRDFNETDGPEGPLVAIVNEALVEESFAGRNPIGMTIFCPFDSDEGMTIIGVVGDVRQRDPAVAPTPECYMPFTQHAYNNSTLYVLVRTAGEPAELAGPARRVAAEISPYVAVSFTTMDATIATRLQDRAFRAALFGLFAALAVCLSMIGVYGVTAYAVERRSYEIGLRVALGASRGSVLRLVQRRGLLLAAVGLGAGMVLAAAATRLLSTALFGVRPVDGPVYLAVAVLLGAATLTAGYVPARRAAVVDPVDVLTAS